MTDWTCFYRVCCREWRLMKAQRTVGLQPVLFYVLIACLLPLGLPLSSHTLQSVGPGVLWMGVLLAMQLSLLAGFSEDARTGTLSMWLMSPFPLSWVLLPVFLCRWLRFMLPLLFVYPVLGMMYHLSGQAIWVSELAIVLGSWSVFSIGFVLSALLVRLLRQTWLLSCLMLPLSVPPLILVSSIGSLAMQGEPVVTPMAWLGALALAAVSVSPGLASIALKLGVSCEEREA